MKHVVADSYEMGPENWTDDFAADFQHRYGYDPLRYLPVLTGRIVGSADQSDRFLWDVRRMVADRVARDYVGGLRDLCHAARAEDVARELRALGIPRRVPALRRRVRRDQRRVLGGRRPRQHRTPRRGVGGAHLRQARRVGRGVHGRARLSQHAGTLKARGDWALCEGINQFVLHVYIHQPWDDRRPGVNAWFGTEFNRNNTWFEYAKPWIDYQRRCSVMLQAGKPVADVAYFIGEDAPKMAGQRKPALPPGYDFDYINADVIENRLHVEDGRFVLPDGMSYRLLVLPPSDTMRPALLKKLGELVAAGGAVFGEPPPRDRRVCKTIRPATPRCKTRRGLVGRKRNISNARTADLFRESSTGSARPRTRPALTASSGNIAATATPTSISLQTRSRRPVRRRFRFA